MSFTKHTDCCSIPHTITIKREICEKISINVLISQRTMTFNEGQDHSCPVWKKSVSKCPITSQRLSILNETTQAEFSPFCFFVLLLFVVVVVFLNIHTVKQRLFPLIQQLLPESRIRTLNLYHFNKTSNLILIRLKMYEKMKHCADIATPSQEQEHWMRYKLAEANVNRDCKYGRYEKKMVEKFACNVQR